MTVQEYRKLQNSAHRAISNALQRNKIKPLPCEICGSSKSQAHHQDYSKPLEVQWLCHKHHREAHRKAGNTGLHKMAAYLRSACQLAIVAGLCTTICRAQLPPEPAPQANRVATPAWTMLTVASVAGAAADAHSTNACLAQGRLEANPLLGSRPSRGQVWGFELAMTGAQTLLSYELRKHGHRKIGMLIPALSAGEHAFAAVHNGCW